MRAAIVLVLACLAAAGCGSQRPHLKRDDVSSLVALAQRIAAEGPCAQKRDLPAIRARAIALVNRHAVPSELQEPFLAAVNNLASSRVTCAPSAPGAAGDGSPTVVQQADDLAAWLKRYSR